MEWARNMRFGYFLKETASNLKRNVLMTVAATSTVAISLLLLGGFLILGLVVNNARLHWEAQVEMSVFLRDDATQGEISSLETEITQMPEVENVSFVSKPEAYEIFKEIYRNEPALWQTIDADDLPASFRIKLTDPKLTEDVKARIVGAPGIDEVNDGGIFVKRLVQVGDLLRIVASVMAVILLVAAAALIANTIRLAIYARREEIGIMKLVGATNWFIRVPFMLEGLMAALTGAAVAGLAVWTSNTLVFSKLSESFPFLQQVFAFTGGEVMTVVLFMTGVGIVVGLIGSFMAVARFLEV
jgi:cell division transport system permease protein